MSSRNNLSHRRTHNLLLISKLLSLRDTASPLTLILDSLEQPAKPLLKEYIRRGQLSKTHITFISFESLKKPNGVDSFIFARRKKPVDLAKEVAAVAPSSSSGPARRRLIIVDAVNPLLSKSEIHLPSYLGSLIAPSNAAAPTQTSMVVTYHHDVVGIKNRQPYVPSDLTLLSYLGTTILTIHSLSHILAQKDARDRSLAAPVFGLEEEQEGVLVGRHDQEHSGGIVIEMEHRRKSGRGVVEWYFLPPASSYQPQELREVVTLLEDHPLYQRPEDDVPLEEEPGSTFELKLTERQRRDREGVVLPYFDAQKGDGPGEGGRILYDMGEEDDFDEEEDEI